MQSKSRKQPVCEYCKHKLKLIGHAVDDFGRTQSYVHKKKEHWTDSPHPATPVFEAVPTPQEATA